VRDIRVVLPVAAALLVAFVLLLVWDPYPTGNRSFDRSRNGLWLGHKWYTGHGVRDGAPVTRADLDTLTRDLARHGIRYAYIHAGPLRADGGIDDEAGEMLAALLAATPDVVALAWLGTRVDKMTLDDAAFRAGTLATLHALRDQGFAGVHFDLEPLRDAHPGYLELLREVRREMGPQFRISQATPRAAPFGLALGPLRRSFWSGDFYRETMAHTDQTVLMAYDSTLTFPKAYVEFVRYQTGLLVDWACAQPGHELLIGIPSYEDVPLYSDPLIENLRTAAQGVRAALERLPEPPDCFSGVAIYANWVTDEEEWATYQHHWIAAEAGH
jgi:hypothetical protein